MTTVGIESRKKLERAARLQWFHWAVVLLSLTLTVLAWRVSKQQVDSKIRRAFDREATQVVELIQERMRKYEEALWGGVALMNAYDRQLDYEQWLTYADSIRIEEKYPGINGIGIIDSVPRAELDSYITSLRRARPAFQVHPEHENETLYPIRYIEPVASNAEAVGLDMAHESNRLAAVEKARDSGLAQITGPIVLVQDAGQTPGFLFYAPFYDDQNVVEGHRQEAFRGIVYAPFVVQRLMLGVLSKEQRHVGLRLSDGESVLYDELQRAEMDFDPEPLHSRSETIAMYGRAWSFDIWSSMSFRAAHGSSQPLLILVGGIVIDILLVGLFLLLSRANRNALQYADQVTEELHQRNVEMEQFVYTASHDLKSPLLTIQGFAGCVRDDLAAGRHDRLDGFVRRITEGTSRMQANVEDLLELSRIGRDDSPTESIDPAALAAQVVAELEPQFRDAGVEVNIQSGIPNVVGAPRRLAQALENLLVNALRHARPATGTLTITVGGVQEGERIHLFVADDGPGVPEKYRQKVFGLFQRLNTDVDGTGIGLAIVKRIADTHGGRAWVENRVGGGAVFYISLPAHGAMRSPAA